MADDTKVPAETYEGKVIDAMVEALKGATSPEMMRAQQILLQRLALEGDVIPSRIPAPKNITEVGGYINLLESLGATELRAQVLASVLGVAGPNPPLGWAAAGPVLFFADRANDRPAGAGQAAIPVRFAMRSDFLAAFDACLRDIHDRGCALPLLRAATVLPPFDPAAAPPADLLPYIGRVLELAPGAALNDPTTDPLALARPTAAGALRVVARQLDATAPKAATVATAAWTAWQCTAAACREIPLASATFLDLNLSLNSAGWYQPTPPAPVSAASPGSWMLWTNITGLVAGRSRYGDELALLYTPAQITASALRELTNWIWDGTAFAPP